VLCFQKQNILICGGIEQNIRGWNPFINTGPIFRLKGTSAVLHLMVNNERDLCISISRDKNVSVFSLKDQTLGEPCFGLDGEVGAVMEKLRKACVLD